MDDAQWASLIERIKVGRCTPFIGAGACHGVLPLGAQLARAWAEDCDYPLSDRDNLMRVAQYLAVAVDSMEPKDRIDRELAGVAPPDFTQPTEPHALLAELPLPLYLTTNYDDFMTRALEWRGRAAIQEICKWNPSDPVSEEPAWLLSHPAEKLNPETPVVFHLHGRFGLPESLVLTEDDYFDIMLALRSDDVLPHQVSRAMANTSLLFIGYSLGDPDFRILHRSLVLRGALSQRRISVAVQLKESDRQQMYLTKYFNQMDVSVYWGDAASFTQELRERWDSRKPALS
jgi:SIR2-like domain